MRFRCNASPTQRCLSSLTAKHIEYDERCLSVCYTIFYLPKVCVNRNVYFVCLCALLPMPTTLKTKRVAEVNASGIAAGAFRKNNLLTDL